MQKDNVRLEQVFMFIYRVSKGVRVRIQKAELSRHVVRKQVVHCHCGGKMQHVTRQLLL